MSCLLARRSFVLAVACLLFCSSLHAIDKTPITRLGIQQGLSNNSIRCIYQDRKGLLWFGTYDGLNLYDGYNFTVFRNRLNDSTSLPHNYIYAIHEDNLNNLWIGTGQGIAIYNGIYSRFRPAYYRTYHTKQVHKISININVIKSDSADNVFMGSNGWGLLIKKKREDIAIQVPIRDRGEERSLITGCASMIIPATPSAS
jgi:ligand-binding sensor domain-containing protein